MSRGLRIAVIGAGKHAVRAHLPSLQAIAARTPGLTLCALCDVRAEHAREMGARFGFARSYTDYRAMLDAESPDAVWLLTPASAMREVGGYLLERGMPVFMEKPPGSSSAETRELAAIARHTQTPNQVAFNRRFAPLLVRMKALLDEAGGMSAASCQMFRVQRAEADFSLGTGIHVLDALRFLSGSEVCEVRTQRMEENSRLVTMIYTSGAYATVEILPQVGVQLERYSAHAGERTVIVDGVVSWLTLFPGFLRCYDGGQLALSIDNAQDPAAPSEVVGGFFAENAHFVDCLLQGEAPALDLSVAVRSMEVAEAVDRGESVRFTAVA